jgi:hypothetical protein
MLPRLTPELRTAFERVSYHIDGVPELPGDAAHAALGRNEPVPARLASLEGGPPGTLGPVTVSDAVTTGLPVEWVT